MGINICPVILCGGSGKRLWPLSRRCYPKQFIDFGSGTLFIQTLERIESLSNVCEPIVVCNEAHRFFVFGLLKEHGKTAKIILESEGRNTAPAIALSSFLLKEMGEDPVLLVLPSDHIIGSIDVFHDAILKGLSFASKGNLVTFGVTPTKPEKGFGYIKPGDLIGEDVYTINTFIEKPDLARAEEYFRSGSYFWNSGMFFFKASVYLDELRKYDSVMFGTCEEAWKSHTVDPYIGFSRPDKELMKVIPSDSIDNVIMGKTNKSCMVVLNSYWNDLGSWDAFYDTGEYDADGNVIQGDVIVQDVKNCYLNTTHRLLCAIGVHSLIVVETEDAILIVDRDKSQDVKELLDSLQSSGRIEAETHPCVFRPWGNYKVLIANDYYKVKKIIVNAGAALSLQKHQHRAEHWVIVKGVAHAHIDGNEYILHENQSIYIPQNSIHRLTNVNNDSLEVIEVQSGSYLGEDDIIRLEDNYGRIIN